MPNIIKLLVIGSNGQLAQSFKAIEVCNQNLQTDYYSKDQLDILEKDELEKVIKNNNYDFVVNFSAFTAVDEAEEKKEQALEVNAIGPKNLAEVTRKNKVFLVHISTDYVFDGLKGKFYTEQSPTIPCNFYGESKLNGEEYIKKLSDRFIIFRVSWLYSEFGKNFFLTMLELASQGKDISVVDDQYGTPTYASDFARNLIKIIEFIYKNDFERQYQEIFHYTNTGSTTWFGFAAKIFEFYELKVDLKRIQTSQLSQKARRPKNTQLSISKIKGHFRIRIPSWEESLSNCINNLNLSKNK